MNRKRSNEDVDLCEEGTPPKRPNINWSTTFIPLELILKILRCGDVKYTLTCRLVCRMWLNLIDEDVQFWMAFGRRRGISFDGLPVGAPDSNKIIVNGIRDRWRAIRLYHGRKVSVLSESKVVGAHEDGILICLNNHLQFYKVSGISMHNFLLELDDENFDAEKYKDKLVFDYPYKSPILTWTTNGEQIHLCNGNKINILKMCLQSDVILVEDMSSFIEYNRNETRMIFLPNNIRVIKKKGRTMETCGISVTFSSEESSQRALYLSNSYKTLLVLYHMDGLVEPTFSHNFSINGGGCHVRAGPYERSVNIFIGSKSLDGTFMKVHSTCLFQTRTSTAIEVIVNPIINLACDAKNCSVITVGATFIVLFDKAEMCLMFYRMPLDYSSKIIQATFSFVIDRSSLSADIDLDTVEFIFPNNVDHGQLGDIGEVELLRCSCRENNNTFLVFCK